MFKKVIAITAALVMAPVVMADNYAPFNRGGFQGPGAVMSVTTVKGITGARDEMPVVLEGNITRQLSNDIYSFTDSTGTIMIEVDDDMRLPVFNAQTRVRLYGEVDNDFMGKEVEVDFLEII